MEDVIFYEMHETTSRSTNYINCNTHKGEQILQYRLSRDFKRHDSVVVHNPFNFAIESIITDIPILHNITLAYKSMNAKMVNLEPQPSFSRQAFQNKFILAMFPSLTSLVSSSSKQTLQTNELVSQLLAQDEISLEMFPPLIDSSNKQTSQLSNPTLTNWVSLFHKND